MITTFSAILIIAIAIVLLLLVLVGAVINEVMHFKNGLSKYDCHDEFFRRLP